jgi:hypothetical protein
MPDEPAPDATPEPTPEPAPADKTFTQAELERTVQDRLARERKKYEGYEDLKKRAEEYDKLQDAQKTELQKAQERADKAEQTAAQRTQAADRRLIEAAVLAEASKQRAIKPEHLHKLINSESVTVGDDGQVTGAEEAVKSFLEANPEYVGNARPGGGADLGARQGAPSKGSFDDVIRQRVAG